MSQNARPVVCVWRTRWLPASNTFVRDQLSSFTRWRGVSAGLVRLKDPLVEPDHVVLREGRSADVVQRAVSPRLLAAWAARSIGGGTAPQLVHAHFAHDGVVVQPIAERLGAPLVVTLHGYDVTVTPDARSAAGFRRMFGRADLLVAVSSFIRDAAIDLGAPPDRVVVHHTGVPLPDPIRDEGQRSGVTFVGRLVEKKGVADLLVAYASLPPSLRDEHPLTIIGSGPLEHDLRELDARHGTRARFTGGLSSAAVGEHYRRSAVVCVPSKRASDGNSEGLPTVILEAGAHGCAVIASDHAGSSEAIVDGRSGLLFAEGDLATFQGRLRDLLRDEGLRRSLGAQARTTIEIDFDIVAQTRRLEVLYDTVVEADRPRKLTR